MAGRTISVISSPRTRGFASSLVPWLVPALLLVLWQGGASMGLISARFLPAPSAIVTEFWNVARSG